MATLYSDLCSLTTVVPAKTELGTNTVIGTYTVPATFVATADVIQMVKVPSGAIIHDVAVACSASIATASAIGVGDGNSTGRFIAAATNFGNGAATLLRLTVPAGVGYAYTADDTIDILMGTVTTPVAGSVIKLTATYTIP